MDWHQILSPDLMELTASAALAQTIVMVMYQGIPFSGHLFLRSFVFQVIRFSGHSVQRTDFVA